MKGKDNWRRGEGEIKKQGGEGEQGATWSDPLPIPQAGWQYKVDGREKNRSGEEQVTAQHI